MPKLIPVGVSGSVENVAGAGNYNSHHSDLPNASDGEYGGGVKA